MDCSDTSRASFASSGGVEIKKRIQGSARDDDFIQLDGKNDRSDFMVIDELIYRSWHRHRHRDRNNRDGGRKMPPDAARCIQLTRSGLAT